LGLEEILWRGDVDGLSLRNRYKIHVVCQQDVALAGCPEEQQVVTVRGPVSKLSMVSCEVADGGAVHILDRYALEQTVEIAASTPLRSIARRSSWMTIPLAMNL
jgi:hypothetical protein